MVIFIGMGLFMTVVAELYRRNRDKAAAYDREVALRERHRLLVETMLQGVVHQDAQGNIIAMNPAAERILGKTPEQFLGSSSVEEEHHTIREDGSLFPGLEHPAMVALRTGQPVSGVVMGVFNPKMNAYRWISIDAVPLFRPGETCSYQVYTVFEDITDRKRAEEALRKSEQEFRALAEAVPQIVWATRPDGWNIYFNQQWMDYTGLTLDESYGHGWNTPFHPDDKQHAWDTWQRATQHGETYSLECRLRRADGVYRWWLIHGVPMRGANGEIQKWFGTCTDIEEIKQAERALREGEQRFRTMAESIPQLAWMAQPDGHIFWYNRRWYEYTGTTLEQMEGWGWQAVNDTDELPRVLKRWKAAIAEGKPWEDTFPLRRHDGTFRPHLSRAEPICDQEGHVVRWFGTNTDITERIEAEEALQRGKEAAEAANIAKSQFLANMSHELRTPMNAILGMIDVALPKATDPTVQDCLQTVKGSADLLLTLLNDLLDSARIESGKLELESAPFSLRRMLDQLTRVLAVRASENGLCFYCRMPEEMPDAVVGDRMRLPQVLLNLAGNAIKFTEQGEVEVSVRALSQDGEACMEFAVRDTGIGISPSAQERLFQSFAQADASMARRFGGTGLGLSICKSLVELMGGHISVESEVGKGSTFRFTVRLPLAEELPSDIDAPVAVPAVACAQLRILLAEDNPANQKLATYVLQDRGHLVEIAGDGQEAIRLTERNRYDVILMDVQMPEMNGLEATAAIRKREEGGSRRVPIIAMTAHAMKGDREKCLAAGMDGYLSKPIDAHEMIALVETKDGQAVDVLVEGIATQDRQGQERLCRAAVVDIGRQKRTDESAAANAGDATSTPRGPASPPAASVFDPEMALARCYDKRNMLQEMIAHFFKDTDSLFPQIRAALQKGDLAEVGRLGHRVKGTLVHLGAEAASEAAGRVERFVLDAGEQSEAEKVVSSLERECEVLRAVLTEYRAATNSVQGGK
jgi:PAS domain S-box-containing protein